MRNESSYEKPKLKNGAIMVKIRPTKNQIIFSVLIEILIVVLLLLQETIPAFHWAYVLVYIPILILVIFGLFYVFKRYTILLIVNIFVGRILPFLVILYNLKFIYGLICIVIFEFVEFIHSKYYPYMFRLFPRIIGQKLNQSWRMCTKLIEKKQYFDAYKQLEIFCSYIINTLENKTENRLTEEDCKKLFAVFTLACYRITALSVTFSRIGRMDYAHSMLENRKKFLLKFTDIMDNLFEVDDEDRAVKRLGLLIDTAMQQLSIGNKAESLKLLSEYERELDIFASQYPNRYEAVFKRGKPFLDYIILSQTDTSISQQKVTLLKEAMESSEKTDEMTELSLNIQYSFESARLAIEEGFAMLRGARFSEAKYSFDKAEKLIKGTKKSWVRNSALEYSGKIFSNIAKSLYTVAESRVKSDTKKFVYAMNILKSTSKDADDAEIANLSIQAINFFEKSVVASVYSNEFQGLIDSIHKNLMAILAKLMDEILRGGFLRDKLSISIEQIQTSNLNKEFIVQGFGIILMIVGIYAQQHLIVLFALFIVGVILLNIGLYLTLKKH